MGMQSIGVEPIKFVDKSTWSYHDLNMMLTCFDPNNNRVDIIQNSLHCDNPCMAMQLEIRNIDNPSKRRRIWMITFDYDTWYRIKSPYRNPDKRGGHIIDSEVILDKCGKEIIKTFAYQWGRSKIHAS